MAKCKSQRGPNAGEELSLKGGGPRATRGEAAVYIAELTAGLSEIAALHALPVLARLLALAESEARQALKEDSPHKGAPSA